MINPATIAPVTPVVDHWAQPVQQTAPPPAQFPAPQAWANSPSVPQTALPPQWPTQWQTQQAAPQQQSATYGWEPPPPEPPPHPFPMVKRGEPGFTLRNVDRDQIGTRPEACLRTAINFERVAVLEKRVRDFKPLPPVILYQAADGALVLVDGWNRLVVYDRLGVTLIPALIIDTSLEDALVAGLRMNMPKEGKLRRGNDAEHALNILATALGRPISVEEAACVGLAHTPNSPIAPGLFNSLCLPQLPSPQPKPSMERKPGKNVPSKSKSPRRA